MPVHVSIHDVSPAWEREVDVALDMARAAGVRPALLVVPDFHARAPLPEHPAFCAKLRALEREGHEIFLHGYYHRARAWNETRRGEHDGGAHRSTRAAARLRHAYAQRVVSGGEAEFSDVSREEGERRLSDGEKMLRDVGLTIRGFVAPAWSMPPWVLAL